MRQSVSVVSQSSLRIGRRDHGHVAVLPCRLRWAGSGALAAHRPRQKLIAISLRPAGAPVTTSRTRFCSPEPADSGAQGLRSWRGCAE